MNALKQRKAQQRVGPGDLWDGKPIAGTQLSPKMPDSTPEDRRNTRRQAVPQSVFTGAQGLPGPGLPTGTVIDFAGIVVPPGWLPCDGSLLEGAKFPGLLKVIGRLYTEEGDGPDDFRLPRTCGKVIVGCGEDLEQREWPLAETAGEVEHTLYASEAPGLATAAFSVGETTEDAVTGYEESPAEPHNNMQPYLVLQKIIKT